MERNLQVVHLLAKQGNSLSHGELMKSHLIAAVEEMYPGKICCALLAFTCEELPGTLVDISLSVEE